MTLKAYLRRLFIGRNRWLSLVLLLTLLSALLPAIPLKQKAPSYQVTFDISQSMHVKDAGQADDLQSRLQLSKNAARHLLQNLPCGSRLGWSVFAGSRVISLITPLEVCSHYEGLVSALDSINGNMRWTNSSKIGKGLHQSLRAATEISPDTNVLFFSDGHEAPPLRTGDRGMPATRNMKVNGIIIGVGGLDPVRIPKYDAQGQLTGYWGPSEVVQRKDAALGTSHEELSQVHEKHLSQLAQLAQLSYVHLQSVDTLIDSIKQAKHGTIQAIPTDLRWIPATLALLVLCWFFRPILGRD